MRNLVIGRYPSCQRLVESLGISGDGVTRIVLTIATDEIVTVQVERAVYQDEMDDFASVLEDYELVRKEPLAHD
jgi:hypothetical protein